MTIVVDIIEQSIFQRNVIFLNNIKTKEIDIE